MAKKIYVSKAEEKVEKFSKELNELEAEQMLELEEKKIGRPKGAEVKKMQLSIPIDFYEGVELGAIFFKGNKTAYINSLIKKDLEQNLEKYKEFKELMERK